MSSTISPNMNLIIPTAGSEPGPDYAFDINASLTLIDQHDHTPGKGVQIVSAAININSDLDFQNHAAINLSRSVFQAQGSPSNINQSISVAPGGGDPLINDLWYTDSNGTQIQITENGSLAAVSTTVSGITYLTGGTFVFTQTPDAHPTRPANLDSGSITLRPNLDGTLNGVTLDASGVSSAYSLVLPTVPLSTQFLTIDSVGVISGTIPTTAGITSSNIASNTIVNTNVRNMQLQIPSTSKSSDYTAVPTDGLIEYDTSGGPHTLTLYSPAASNNAGQTITVKKFSNDFNTLAVVTASGLIDGASSTGLHIQNECVVFQNDGTNWYVISRTYPEGWQAATFTVPTSGGHSNNGITGYTSQSSFVRRVGDSLECRLYLQQIGVSANSQSYIGIPFGLFIETSKLVRGTVVGTMFIQGLNHEYVNYNGTTPAFIQTVFVDPADNGVVSFGARGTNTSPNSFDNLTWNNSFSSGDVSISATFSIPIAGWE